MVPRNSATPRAATWHKSDGSHQSSWGRKMTGLHPGDIQKIPNQAIQSRRSLFEFPNEFGFAAGTRDPPLQLHRQRWSWRPAASAVHAIRNSTGPCPAARFRRRAESPFGIPEALAIQHERDLTDNLPASRAVRVWCSKSGPSREITPRHPGEYSAAGAAQTPTAVYRSISPRAWHFGAQPTRRHCVPWATGSSVPNG